MPSHSAARPVIPGAISARASFITRTYSHVLAAILVFVAFEVWLFRTGNAERLAALMRPVPWPMILGAFLLVAWLATRMAYRLKTRALQYAGLGLYILAKGIIIVPLLFHANAQVPGVIGQAAQVTILGTLGLTAVAYLSRKDFSSWRPYIYWGSIVAIILIIAAYFVGLRLGTWFSVAMIAWAGASVLYDTGKILNRGHYGNHVGAALSLFASIGMMFWYIVRLTGRRG